MIEVTNAYIMWHVGWMAPSEMRSRMGITTDDEWEAILFIRQALIDLHYTATGVQHG